MTKPITKDISSEEIENITQSLMTNMNVPEESIDVDVAYLVYGNITFDKTTIPVDKEQFLFNLESALVALLGIHSKDLTLFFDQGKKYI